MYLCTCFGRKFALIHAAIRQLLHFGQIILLFAHAIPMICVFIQSLCEALFQQQDKIPRGPIFMRMVEDEARFFKGSLGC